METNQEPSERQKKRFQKALGIDKNTYGLEAGIEESEQETVDFEQEQASDDITNILALQRHKEAKGGFN